MTLNTSTSFRLRRKLFVGASWKLLPSMNLRPSVAWQIEFSPRARKAVRRLDKQVQRRLFQVLGDLSRLNDPRVRGKALVGGMSGLWRWRVGDYRVIAEIQDDIVTVLVVDVGHRGEIYR
ncbi:type II toxin-antitoxin system RelE/ParE family toxin [Corynebacterium sp. UMB10321]|uniref:type II toxin-antitoxin system RelE family toxin n=1 Tax=Corynebacterium sp. UMB10321 TaxID=3046312 RepID=UPI0030156CC6